MGWSTPGTQLNIADRAEPFNRRVDGVNGNGRAIYVESSNNYRVGMNLTALSSLLAVFTGTPVQHGPLANESWAVFIQDMVDFLGRQQQDGGAAKGSWHYGADGNETAAYGNASTSMWAYKGSRPLNRTLQSMALW